MLVEMSLGSVLWDKLAQQVKKCHEIEFTRISFLWKESLFLI